MKAKGLAQKAAYPPVGKLAVTCWCERDIVYVRPGDIASGITGCCGRPECRSAA